MSLWTFHQKDWLYSILHCTTSKAETSTKDYNFRGLINWLHVNDIGSLYCGHPMGNYNCMFCDLVITVKVTVISDNWTTINFRPCTSLHSSWEVQHYWSRFVKLISVSVLVVLTSWTGQYLLWFLILWFIVGKICIIESFSFQKVLSCFASYSFSSLDVLFLCKLNDQVTNSYSGLQCDY